MPPIGELPPPEGITPELPQGVTPPIGTLPPDGITPELPTKPPEGITPELPQGVTPPIGTLPPEGITPGLPTKPPTGITPELPQGVTPPIGTLPPEGITPGLPTKPPTGITPELPQGVTPPIGTLPPEGITPGLPTKPPTGITPELPQGVTPPIGTLPPEGITPGLPTKPPTGITPELPGGVTPPIGVRPPAGGGVRPGGPKPPSTTRVEEIVAAQQATSPKHGWNVWMDDTYLDISNDRNGADVEGTTNTLTFGADRTVRPGLVVGFTVGWQDAHTSLFENALRIETDGLNAGFYVGWLCSEQWMLDASINYNQSDTDQKILTLNGSYEARAYTASVGVTGQFLWKKIAMRPRVAVTYGTNKSDAYTLAGTLNALPLLVDVSGDSFDSGTADFSIEFSRVYRTGSGKPLMPYLNLEADYAFQSIGTGDPVSGDLSEVRNSDWSGAVRAGVRLMLSGGSTVTLAGGYTSFGVSDVDIYEWRLYLSHSF